jgi:beta-glucosidase
VTTRIPWNAAEAPDVDPRSVRFPPGFLLGVASSAHQVEGGTTANTWSAWELTTRPDGSPRISGGDRCGRAADHWSRFAEDVELLRWLGVGMYRLSVEWSRVEPLPGLVDGSVLDRYRQRCVDLRAVGIEPMVTLHHVTEPQWTAERGGFGYRPTTDAWLRFVALCVDALGDVVRHWTTVDRPVDYVVRGWLRGEWPPGLADPAAAVRVLENLLLAHARAYRVIHAADRGGWQHHVGIAHDLMPMRPARPFRPLDRLQARRWDLTYNRAVPDALTSGVLRLRLYEGSVVRRHPELRGTQDFFGLSHDHRVLVRAGRSWRDPVELFPGPGERSDLGRSLEPWSLADVARDVARYGLPVIVTGHGTADMAVPDLRRRRWLGASLAALAQACNDGVDVRGYLYGSLLDGFEWSHGFGARTGLFRVAGRDLRRIPTSSAAFYRDVVAAQQRGGRSGPG